MSIADKITRLQNAKTSIAAAIAAKGGTVIEGDGYEDFSTDIGTIPTGIDPSDATATADKILSGYTAYIADGSKATGTMPNNGAVSETVAVGGTYTVPAGYHNGSGTVSGPILDGNAEQANVVSGYTFYSNSGTKLTGTMDVYNWEWTTHHDTNPMTAAAATDAGFSWG